MLPGVKEQKVDMNVMRKQIFPVSVCFAVSLVLSNKAYIYLSVSYIQVGVLSIIFFCVTFYLFTQFFGITDVKGFYTCCGADIVCSMWFGEGIGH